MKAITVLPPNYRQRAILEPSKRFIVSAVIAGTVLLIVFGWLLVQFIETFRPVALDGMRLDDILTPTPAGMAIEIPLEPIRDVVIALVLVLIIHEVVHGLFYFWFSGKSPRFGLHGPFPYAAAPEGVYFYRNHFIIVGIAPLVLLTLVGLPLMMIVPEGLVPILLFFVAFNASGAAGDLLMTVQLLTYSSETILDDAGATVNVYGPAKS